MTETRNESLDNSPERPDALTPHTVTTLSDRSVEEVFLRPGMKVDRFVLEREVGRGGFGIVYQALDPNLNRFVALKIPRCDSRDAHVSRLQREAQIIATLDHPGICRVYEAQFDSRIPYIVSQLCDGPDLREWLLDNPNRLSFEAIAELIGLLADALQYAHSQGVLHRDIKPGNVLLFPPKADNTTPSTLSFQPRLTDFGLASMSSADWSNTRTSVVLGTLMYMAPECLDGAESAPAAGADIYSLGAMMYELLTGQPLMEGAQLGEFLQRISNETPELPHRIRPDTPIDLSLICSKCLRKEVDERYRSAAELSDDLQRYLDGRPVVARMPTRYERFTKWCSQPQRLRIAGLSSLWCHLLVVGWMFSQLAVIIPLGLTSQADIVQSVQDFVWSAGLVHLPKAWLGYRLICGSRWAFWISAVTSLGCLSIFLVSAFDTSAAFEHSFPTPLTKVSVFSILIIACLVESINYLLAIPAYLRTRAKKPRQQPVS
ncbi:Serine/threonine-protein kinase PknB [Rosistilla ulvae]|uniref:non-specific serine/threonine protein kinase n=1 Tax=Rosistilla ulvae TaxID=1930277 RepID=A0A517LWB0_9BACT|nr:Serine/threonine-protein kinase PknB [Rosistilla ulvae]